MKRLQNSLLFAALTLPLIGCAGGGGSDSGSLNSSARLLVGSTGDSGLFSLDTELTEVRLVQANGQRTGNLLTASTSVEWVGVGASSRWLATGNIPAGTYTELVASIAPGSVTGRDTAGDSVPMSLQATSFRAPFERAWAAGSGQGTESILLDMDLSGSVFQTGTGGGMVLDPDAVVVLDDQRPIQSVSGTVSAASAFEHLLTMDASGPTGVSFGRLDVSVDQGTQLFDVDGTAFPTPDGFFQSLRPNLSMIGARGRIDSGGILRASSIRILDQGGGPLPPDVTMEGRVLHNDPQRQRFVLLMRSIVHGASLADPVLKDLGDPVSLEISYDSSTVFLNHEGEHVSASELEKGTLVQVHFPTFTAAPFSSDLVEFLESGKTITGGVVDVAGLPDSFVISVDEDEDENGIGAGRVTVDLTGADIELDFRGHPTLAADSIIAGLQVRVQGNFGPGTGSQLIHADAVEVKPGHLIHAEVSRFDAAAGSFEVSNGRIVQPFGDSVTAPPLTIRLAPSVRFMGQASSAAEFFRLAANLDPSEHLEVKVKGIGTQVAEVIEAFEVKVDVEQGH